LSRYQSDHNALILYTDPNVQNYCQYSIKFDPNWITQEGFSDLVINWWQSYQLDINDLGNSWKIKLQIMRRKFRGWHINTKGKSKKEKKNFCQSSMN
jgi:hypothetical protein